MFCPACGATAKEFDRFCSSCGGMVSAIDKPHPDRQGDSQATAPSKKYSLEKVLISGVDVLAALLYLLLAWGVFFSDEMPDLESGAEWFGVALAFGFVALIAKLLKSVLGTIGRAFDSSFGNQ